MDPVIVGTAAIAGAIGLGVGYLVGLLSPAPLGYEDEVTGFQRGRPPKPDRSEYVIEHVIPIHGHTDTPWEWAERGGGRG